MTTGITIREGGKYRTRDGEIITTRKLSDSGNWEMEVVDQPLKYAGYYTTGGLFVGYEDVEMCDRHVVAEIVAYNCNPDDNPKDIAGRGKPQMHLVPVTTGVVRVMELGAKKYGPYNWRDKKIAMTVYVSAAMRHLRKFLDGETIDDESGQTHIEHAAAGLLILADAMDVGAIKDDRPTPRVPKGEL